MTYSASARGNVREQEGSSLAGASTKTQARPDAQNCLVCGLGLRPRFAAVLDAKTLEVFSIFECPKCGIGCTIPKPDTLTRYYQDYHGGRHGITNTFCTNRRIRILQKLTRNRAGKRLLDIGCGDGTFLLAGKANGWSVVGTEMNPMTARAAGLEVLPQVSDLSELAPFDCITLWHSLEHMQDPRATLQGVRNLLTPDGVLIVAVPDAGGLQARVFGPKWLHLDVPRHLYHFTRGSLESLLRVEGFTPVHEWHQEFEYDLLGWSQSALNYGPAAPNLFFDLLTGRRPAIGRIQRISTWITGCLLTAFAIFLVLLGTSIRSGGTVIVAARPGKNHG